MRGKAALAIPFLAAALLPESAPACAVCAGGGEESRTAFIVTTVGMSVLPPAMVGALVWWIWRRTRERETAGAERG